MRKLFIILVFITNILGEHMENTDIKDAYFAGGCFWGGLF